MRSKNFGIVENELPLMFITYGTLSSSGLRCPVNNTFPPDLEEWMIYQRLLPSAEFIEPELGLRHQDELFNWNASYFNYEEPERVAQFLRFNLNQVTNIVPEMPSVQFSSEQNRVLNFVRDGIDYIQNNRNGQINRSMIVQGKAGSGKSTIIKATQSLCNQNLGNKSYITLAQTGSAASLINGFTIHSKLVINTDNELRTLSRNERNNLQLDLKDCSFVIIDEFSLIGCSLFKKIDTRLREAKGLSRKKFGGMFLLLFGDIKQLPPIKDRPFYGTGYNHLEHVELGQQLYLSIKSAVILPVSFRQDVRQQQFRDLLDRIPNGEVSHSDWQMISSRRMSAINANRFIDSVRLFDTNAKVHEYNESKLKSFQHVYRVKAINNCTEASRANSKDADNLENVLHIAVGARVMLRRNLSTSNNLTNGSLRTITDIVVGDQSDMPLFVMVNFDRYNGSSHNNTGSVPIKPVESTWRSKGILCKREQLPLVIAYGFTIHKSQEMTLNTVFVDIGEREAQLGLTYVAFSRVHTLGDLALEKSYDYHRFSLIGASELMRLRKNEESRLLRLNNQ